MVQPHRAGVSAFGFGGTNFHIALEAYNEKFTETFKEWNRRWLAYTGEINRNLIEKVESSKSDLIPQMSWEQLKLIISTY